MSTTRPKYSKDQPKALNDKTIEMVSARFRVLGDPLRLRLLDVLRGGETTVGALVEALGATQANVSKHLQILLRAGLVLRRKEGLHAYYAVADPSIFDLCDIVCGSLGERLEENLEALRGTARRTKG